MSATFKDLGISTEGAVGIVEIQRPPHNFFDNSLINQIADAFEAFQDGRIRVLVTKPSIAGMGMNFQNCHRMVFVGISDSWESYYQAIRRCYRFGQNKEVEAHIVVSDLEMQIVDNVRRKEHEVAGWISRLIASNAYNQEQKAS